MICTNDDPMGQALPASWRLMESSKRYLEALTARKARGIMKFAPGYKLQHDRYRRRNGRRSYAKLRP